MNAADERSRSLWMDTVVADAPALSDDKRFDTVVVGSGIAGLSTAYELACRGQKVAVLDRGRIAGGMTSRTSAHLTSQSDDGFKTVTQVRGLDGAKAFYESHAAAIDRIEAIAQEERIECHFRRVNGYLFPAIGKDPAEELTPEFEATKKVGMPIERHTGLPFKGLEQVRSLRYPNLATFHPLRYLRGVADAFVRRGGALFADTTVTAVEEKDGAVTVRTANDASVQAGDAVIATNSPINDLLALHTKLAPYRTYAMAITIERDSIEDALYWDTLDPYHYVRLENGRGATQYLIVGGADHKTGEADDGWARFEGIESWIRALLPKLGNVTHRWSGQTLDPVDYAAFSGRNPGNDHVFVHTGDSDKDDPWCRGKPSASRLITGETCPWADFYDPARVTVSAAKNVHCRECHGGEEFRRIHCARRTEIGRRVEAGRARSSAKDCARLRLTGTTRCPSRVGRLHPCRLPPALEFFRSCWDCPCHGSHFAIDGTPLNGPAVAPLEQVD